MDASPSENAITKKKKSSRRSSILKRRPLGNMNMNEELKDRASLLPSKRRVSFAACNEMREICEHTTDLSAHVKIPAVLLPEDKQALNSDSAQQDLVLAKDDRASSHTSTPVGAKHPKRMSLAFSRLSIIPPDGGAPSQEDDSGSALLLDPEGPGGCEGQFPPPSLRQLETIAGPSDSLHGDQESMELTCIEPHGEPLQPVSNDGDHSMDADDFVAYEDHSNDLPQSIPRRLDDAVVDLGNQALGEKSPTCGGSSVLIAYSSASGGVHDLVQRKCESLAVVDMSLDLSCTSSPRQPCIHPHLTDVVGGDRSANSHENSHTKNDRELEDGQVQTEASKDTSHAIQPDASNMSFTCQTPMLSRVGLPKVDGTEGTHTLQMQASNDTSHAIQPEVSNMSLTGQPLMLGRDEASKRDGGNAPADTLNHRTPPSSCSISLTCEPPLHNGDGAQDRRHSTVLGSSQIDRDVVVDAPMDQAPATFDSSVTELTCKIPAIQPLLPQDCSTGSHTSSNASPLSQGSHSVTLGKCLPAKDADVQREGRSKVLRQSPAGERPKTRLVSVTTVKPPTVSTSTDDSPSRAQLSNSLPLSTSVAISDTHRLPKIGLTRQSKRIRPSTRALKKRISVPRSLTTSKMSALAQVNYSASILHSSAAATLPYIDSALAPAVKDETARKADNPEHHAETVGSGSEEEAAGTSQGNRSASLKEMTQQDAKEDRIKQPQEVAEDIREGLPVDHVAEMGCEKVTDFDSVQDRMDTSVQDRTHMSVQDRTHTSVEEGTDTSVQDRMNTSVQDRTHMCAQDKTRTSVEEGTDTSVQDRMNTSVQDRMDTSVLDRTHTCAQDKTRTSVEEGTHASMREGQNASVLQGEHRLTPSDEGIARQRNECTLSFSKTYTLSTLPGGCLSPTDGQLVSVTTVVGGSSNDSESRIPAKQDDGELLCSITAPLDATREVSHRCRHLNRTYSISPNSSFFSAKEEGSWKEETFSSPLPVEAASLVAVTAAPLPSGTTHLCPSPCLSEGNWMHGKDADISLVDSSMSTLPADRTLTPQARLKTAVGGHAEEEVKNVVAAPVCTALTTTPPPSGTDVNEQGISTARPTEDVGTTHRCHANPNDVSRCSVTEGALNTTHRRHANPNDVSRCSVTEGALNTTHRCHAIPNDVSRCSVTEGTLNTTHRRHANPNDVSRCSVTEGTLNTTLQPAEYDSPLLQVFKTPGGGTPGTLLRSKLSFVTTPWSARSSFTPIIPDRSTPGSTAPSRLWVDLPVSVTMENAPEFFNVDRAEVKALDKAEALKRLAVGYQELHTVLQSDEGQALNPSTIDARLLQAGLNCAMEGMGHLYALMKYQEQYCGKLFPWPLEDQVTSVYDAIEVSFEAGDRLHWIARKRVEMELLLRQAKALMRGTPKAYRWLIHSWTKDVIRFLFLQPMVAVTVNVLPSCEIGSHMIDADISLNVADSRITSKDAFILDKYSVQGSLPKVAAEVLLKVAALCQEQRHRLS